MKLREALVAMRSQLTPLFGEAEAAALTTISLEQVTGLPRSHLKAEGGRELTPSETEEYNRHLSRLLKQEPIQYIIQKAWFYGFELFVGPQVLIPRPETEELVHWIVGDCRERGLPVFERLPAQADRTEQLKILDVGTGSGCIALALKATMPLAEVWGCDISDEALTIARRNGATLDIRVDFQAVDFLHANRRRGLPSVDILVSNPPYIPQSEEATLQVNVREHEPHGALFVPNEDPLIFYRALAQFGHQRLHAGGWIYMEIHEAATEAVATLFRKEGYTLIEQRRDLQGKDRMIRAGKG
jgi:release factor glutamine methyltransferase